MDEKILVIGTRREYLESVWVQCEWRRWLYLKHIGVRGRDSLVALIPSEDEWSYIRPREWDEQRITVYTDIDGALEALMDKPAAAPAPVQAAPAAEGWKCACGTVNTGKFCTECGTPRAEKKKFCPQCGAVTPPGSKFCTSCGARFG